MNSTRLGLYETIDKLEWTRSSKTGEHSMVLCVIWGGFCGVIGAAVGCPLYMIKTQLQSQSNGQFAVGYQHTHKGTIEALRSTYKERGFRGLWRGFQGIVPRTGVGSSVQLGTFTNCKDYLRKYEVCLIFR